MLSQIFKIDITTIMLFIIIFLALLVFYKSVSKFLNFLTKQYIVKKEPKKGIVKKD